MKNEELTQEQLQDRSKSLMKKIASFTEDNPSVWVHSLTYLLAEFGFENDESEKEFHRLIKIYREAHKKTFEKKKDVDVDEYVNAIKDMLNL